MKNILLNKNITCIVFVFIMLLGFVLRFVYLGDWTHFELDQARDAKLLANVVQNGIGELPLLGPRAGGTFLRLAPGYYYLEYIGAFIFGATPVGFTVPITILSLATLPILYLLLRRLFTTRLSLFLMAIYAVSTYVVLYGRFAWNPNALPFFIIFGLYALLRSVDIKERHAARWFLLATFMLVFATHLHFLAFVSVPVVVVTFLLLKRPRFSWRTWLATMGIICALYIPVALNESITGGTNSQEFLQAVTGKSNKSSHVIIEKVVRNVTNQAFGYWVILTGYEGSSFGQFAALSPWNYELTCDDECHEHLPSSMAALLLVLTGMVAGYDYYRQTKSVVKRDAVTLTGLWFGVTFLLFTPLSYDFSPRFFLLTAFVPFILVGYGISWLERHTTIRYVRFATGGILVLFIVSNIYFTVTRLKQIAVAGKEDIRTAPDRILKEKSRVSLEQQYRIVEHLHQAQQSNGAMVYMFSEPEYRRALKYLMETKGVQNDVLGFSGGIYAEGNYFYIVRTASNQQNRLIKYLVNYTIAETTPFGTLTVYRLQPKPEAITAQKQIVIEDVSTAPRKSAPGVPLRYTWSEWWSHSSGVSDDEVTDDEISEEE